MSSPDPTAEDANPLGMFTPRSPRRAAQPDASLAPSAPLSPIPDPSPLGSLPGSVAQSRSSMFSPCAPLPNPCAPGAAVLRSPYEPPRQHDDERVRASLFQDMDIHLSTCLEAVVHHGASDLHIGAGQRPAIRIDGDLHHMPDFDEPWSAAKMGKAIRSLITEAEWERFNTDLELDLSIDLDENYRFRVNLYFDSRGAAAAFRLIPNEIQSLQQLGMPESVQKLATLPRGLVLVTGPTGSGKSTTLAAMLDYVNRTRRCHILTIEDPIEFVHHGIEAVINQREVGRDTKSFSQALRRALRQDPDVILVGELRDHETIQVALTAAETGHLVLSTLHTQDSVQTIDRIIDVFPSDQQPQIRTQLGSTLKGVVSQTLLRKTNGGRVAASEILITTPAISNMIREGKTHMLYSALQAGREFGMRTLEQHLAQLAASGQVQRSDALTFVKDAESFKALENRYSDFGGSFRS